MIPRWAPVLLAAACQPATLPAPRLERVEPRFAYNGEERTVTIVGANFYPQVQVSAANGSVDVDRSFGAWLVGPGPSLTRTAFAGVSIEDDAHLRATVEAGLEPGLYDLEVEGPTGRTARLVDAFTVTDTEAVQLVVSSGRIVYTVPEAAQIDIELVDLGGDVVAIPLEIAVVASADATFNAGTLGDARPTPDGDGILGQLRAGRATVGVQADLPGQIRISAAPWDAAVPILDDFVDLTFEPGEDTRVQLTLPPGDRQYVAGRAFTVEASLVDQYENPVPSRTSVTLRTACSGWVADIELNGPTPVDVAPAFACENDTLSVVRGSVGESEPFDVLPGPADHFELALAQTVRNAGDTLNVLVDPVDAFGNRAAWSGALELETDLETLDGLCLPLFGSFYCTPTVTKAGEPLTVSVRGEDGLTGQIGGLTVLPDDVPASVALSVAGPARAGQPHPVSLVARDTWDNPMDASQLGAEAFEVTDDLGEAICEPAGFYAGEALLDCTLYTARPGAALIGSIPAFSVVGTSAPLAVDNGLLGVVAFSGERPVRAGETLTLALTASDAWGNPYLVQDDPEIELDDDTGTWSMQRVTLEPDGTAQVLGTLTRAGRTSVRAYQGGAELGASDPIDVEAGPTTELRVTPLGPWGWVGVPRDVRVESVDVWGNRTDLSGGALLASRLTHSPDVPVTLVNGVGVNAFSWTEPALLDILDASAAPFTGSSVPFAVGQDCGASGPAPMVTFGGADEAVACLDPLTDLATISGDFSGSTPGGAALAGFALSLGGAPARVDTVPVLDLDLPGAGAHPLLGLAIDAAGCAAEVATTGWAGPDDGSVVGPIPLSTLDDDLGVFDTVTFDVVGATDCSGDPASAQQVRVRSTAGTLSGPTATGAGLALALDVNGDARFDVVTTGGLQRGVASVHAWVPSGGASAAVDLPLVGDNVPPTVLAQAPTGATAGPVSQVALTFSEPMLPVTLTPASFAVTGPYAVSVVSVTPSAANDEVTLGLDVPADGDIGAWTLTANGFTLRDAAGNRLAGTWGPSFANYTGTFGDVIAAVDDVSCLVQGDTTFRPDGDDGAGAEADQVVVELSSAGAPAWWVVEVVDGAGELIDQQWRIPAAAIDTIRWDGRALSGLVVPDGTYTLRVRPDDGLGNRGAGCDLSITVDHR